MPNTSPLDTFEANLLAELRGVVATRAERSPRRPVRTMSILATAAAVVGAAIAVAVPLSSGGNAAFAINHSAEGDIVVTIDRLSDASALENALAAEGLPARVQYHGDLFDPTTLPAGPSMSQEQCASSERPTIELGNGDVTVTIPASTVTAVRNGQTLTINIDTIDPEDPSSRTENHGDGPNGMPLQDPTKMLVTVGNRLTGCGTYDTGGLFWYDFSHLGS